jgi:hypothetical protein
VTRGEDRLAPLEDPNMSDNPTLPVITPEKAARLRASVQERLAARRAKQATAPPDPAPRYDDVFFHGVAWLNRLSYDDSFDDVDDVAPAF